MSIYKVTTVLESIGRNIPTGASQKFHEGQLTTEYELKKFAERQAMITTIFDEGAEIHITDHKNRYHIIAELAVGGDYIIASHT